MSRDTDLHSRYLALLGVSARPPGVAALDELVAAHATRVPFENVSKLLFRGDRAMRLPPLERYLDGIEHHRFGGTCYANNSHLVGLLAHLGYEARLCGADMNHPDVHVVVVVTLEGGERLVDVGYGAPFLTSMPLDEGRETRIALGRDEWVLHPRDADGRPRVELLRDGTPRHGYRVNPRPRRIEEFDAVIEASFRDVATFMNSVVIARFAPGRSTVLQNLVIVESVGREFRRESVAESAAGLPAAIANRFGMNRDLVARALAGVSPVRDVWG